MSDDYIMFSEIPSVQEWVYFRPFTYDTVKTELAPCSSRLIVNLNRIDYLTCPGVYGDQLIYTISFTGGQDRLCGKFLRSGDTK
jgi:hypothetical protein